MAESAVEDVQNIAKDKDIARFNIKTPMCQSSTVREGVSHEPKINRELKVDLPANTCKIISVYRNLKTFLKSKDFTQDLREELEQSHPHYLSVLGKWREDIEKEDHGIVIAGETSSGKSTLINKILGKEIFEARLQESTATICKIRNCDRIKIITERSSNTEEKDFTDECDVETKEGVELIRNYLKDRTDLEVMPKDEKNDIQCVDIGFPIPFLKGNTIMVDTPGIGGSGTVTHRLKKYLPNALFFIFVIDVSSAGGLQFDRLPELLEEINTLIIETKMPCFHPENVMFVTNKWKIAAMQTKQAELNNMWETLPSKLKDIWPVVNKEHIFRIDLHEESSDNQNIASTSFGDFMKMLESMSKKSENLRTLQHLRFLKTMLINILKSMHARIKLKEDRKEEQNSEIEENKRQIKMLEEKNKQFKKEHKSKIKTEIETIVKECEDYMLSKEGKKEILNESNCKPIHEVNWNATDFNREIKRRIDLYVAEHLKSDDVLNRFKNLAEDIKKFRKEVLTDINAIENEWTEIEHSVEEYKSHLYFIQLGIITSPVWITVLATGLGLPAAIVGGVIFAVTSLIKWTRKTDEEIDDEYRKYLKVVTEEMRTLLNKKRGSLIDRMVDNVTDELSERVSALELRLDNISKKRTQILADQNKIVGLSLKVNTMVGNVNDLIESLECK